MGINLVRKIFLLTAIISLVLGCGAKLYNPSEHYVRPPTDDDLYGHSTLAKWDHNKRRGLIFVLVPRGSNKPSSGQLREAATIALDLCSPNGFGVSKEGLDYGGGRYMYHWWVYCEGF